MATLFRSLFSEGSVAWYAGVRPKLCMMSLLGGTTRGKVGEKVQGLVQSPTWSSGGRKFRL